MEGPRSPAETELPHVIEFLNSKLREGASWSIAHEYPTALQAGNRHNMRIIVEKDEILSHAVLKPLIIKSPHVVYKIGAVGSVVTHPDHRNKGLSTQVLENCLAEASRQKCDLAILWTDKYDFYRRMGFELAGSEISFLINEGFTAPADGLRFSMDAKISPEAILRLYSGHTVGSVRTLEDIRKFLSIPQTRIYTAWEPNGQLAAYAVEGKGADLGGYLHEWGGGVSKLLALVSWIRSQRQGPLTVIAPRHSSNLVSQLTRTGAAVNEGFLGMIKVLNFDQLAAKIKRGFRAEGVADIVLERQGDALLFGIGNELFTLQQEADIIRLLFGPVDIGALDMFSETARAKLGKVLPLPLWIWGWDSV